jgi:hypothetical protein
MFLSSMISTLNPNATIPEQPCWLTAMAHHSPSTLLLATPPWYGCSVGSHCCHDTRKNVANSPKIRKRYEEKNVVLPEVFKNLGADRLWIVLPFFHLTKKEAARALLVEANQRRITTHRFSNIIYPRPPQNKNAQHSMHAVSRKD